MPTLQLTIAGRSDMACASGTSKAVNCIQVYYRFRLLRPGPFAGDSTFRTDPEPYLTRDLLTTAISRPPSQEQPPSYWHMFRPLAVQTDTVPFTLVPSRHDSIVMSIYSQISSKDQHPPNIIIYPHVSGSLRLLSSLLQCSLRGISLSRALQMMIASLITYHPFPERNSSFQTAVYCTRDRSPSPLGESIRHETETPP